MNTIVKKSDVFGAMSSSLCLIHCLATPFLLVVPFWWSNLNYIFIIVSLIAVYISAKNTSRKIMKVLLWIGFMLLSFCILNEELGFFHLPEFITYFAASNLACLHIYNLKYCQCSDEECCGQKN
tara:strand:+ start:223 stop:594 length:372 start_codon:yes stop_codon:yes gene_type:complete